MTNEQIVRCCEPFYPALESIFELAWRSVGDAVSLVGIPNKVERAGIMHVAVRSELRLFGDRLEPIARLVEGADGADYMLIDTGQEEQIAVCWGRYSNGHIRRNSTQRRSHIHSQGSLPFSEGSVDESEGEAVAVSIGYTVEDDYVEVGRPAWWLGRLVLVRERKGSSEFIHDVCVYPKADQFDDSVLADTFIEIRAKQRCSIEHMADKLRRKIG